MSARPLRTVLRGGIVLGVTAVAAVATALPASAHVTTQPGTADAGGFTAVSFRVPDESSTAGTVKIEVHLPTDHPISSVRTTPVTGWTAKVTKAPLNPPVTDDDGNTVTTSVSAVTWTANAGTRINPGEYVDFTIAMGPLPTGVAQIAFPTLQTYDSGEVVSWIEQYAPGAAEPEHPAPILTLKPATAAPATDTTPPTTSAATDDTAIWLSGAALLLGALGVGIGAGAVLQGPRNRPTSVEAPVEAARPTPAGRS